MTIKQKYTRIEKFNGKWQAVLVVAPQSFGIGLEGSKADAQYLSDMLATALETIIKQEARP